MTQAGLLADDAALSASMLVCNTLPLANGNFGRGIQLNNGASLELSDALLSQNNEYGLLLTGDETAVLAERVAIRDTQPQVSDGTLGRGLEVSAGATLTLQYGIISGNRLAQVWLRTVAQVHAEDFIVSDTEPQLSDGTRGWGLNVSGGADVTALRGIIKQNTDLGIRISHYQCIAYGCRN